MMFLEQIRAYWQRPDTSRVKVVDGEILDAEEVTPTDANGPELDRIGKRPAPHRIGPVKQRPTDFLTLDTLLKHPQFPKDGLKQGFVPLGLTRQTNALLFQSWKKMTTGVIAGRRNFGKSSILKAFALCALHARAQGLDCKLYPFDPHHNLPDSTGSFFKPILHQFDRCFLGMESLEDGKHLELFYELKELVKHAQAKGLEEVKQWHILFIDEMDLFFKNKAHGKETYELIEYLVNLRKAGIFFLMSFADTTKSGSGKIGTSIVSAGTSVFCVNYDMTRARIVLPGTNEARKALNLPVGYAAVKIPDSKVMVCRMPYCTEADLQPFLR